MGTKPLNQNNNCKENICFVLKIIVLSMDQIHNIQNSQKLQLYHSCGLLKTILVTLYHVITIQSLFLLK